MMISFRQADLIDKLRPKSLDFGNPKLATFQVKLLLTAAGLKLQSVDPVDHGDLEEFDMSIWSQSIENAIIRILQFDDAQQMSLSECQEFMTPNIFGKYIKDIADVSVVSDFDTDLTRDGNALFTGLVGV